ncbi:unnamed protein product, partial [Prunus brigantina]
MSRVVKRKIQKIKPVVEYNKRGRPHGKAAGEMQSYVGVLALTRDFSKLDLPPPLLALCQFAETKLKALNETVIVKILEEVFGYEHDTYTLDEDILQLASMVEIASTMIAVYMRYLFDYLKMENMVNLVGLVDPGQVSAQFGTLSHRAKHLVDRLKKAD